MKLTKADQPPRKSRKHPQTASDDEAEEERAKIGNAARSSLWLAEVYLAKQCSMRAAWSSPRTQQQRKLL